MKSKRAKKRSSGAGSYFHLHGIMFVNVRQMVTESVKHSKSLIWRYKVVVEGGPTPLAIWQVVLKNHTGSFSHVSTFVSCSGYNEDVKKKKNCDWTKKKQKTWHYSLLINLHNNCYRHICYLLIELFMQYWLWGPAEAAYRWETDFCVRPRPADNNSFLQRTMEVVESYYRYI